MANICTNMLYLSTKDKHLRNAAILLISRLFRCNNIRQSDNGEIFDCEIEFDSSWTFPHKKMEELTKGLPQENDLYIRVLSYEFVCEYVGFNIYTAGEWCDKFADKF